MFSLAIYLVIMYVVSGVGASLTYHRILTHKAVQLQPWFEKLMVLIALPAGTPVQWVGTHRQHHNCTDVAGDPHSPHLKGFWFAHCGWYIGTSNTLLCVLYALGGPLRMLFDGYWRPRNGLQYNYLAPDISAQPFYNSISKPLTYMVILWLYAAIVLTPAFLLWGKIGVIAVWIMLIVVYNLGDAINSFGHLYGNKLSNRNASRNNSYLAFFTFGEGYHSNHHHAPNAIFSNNTATFSLSKGIIKLWVILKLIKN